MKNIEDMTGAELAALFPRIKQRLFALGLLRTAHEFDAGPEQAIGWELAEIAQHSRTCGAEAMDRIARARRKPLPGYRRRP